MIMSCDLETGFAAGVTGRSWLRQDPLQVFLYLAIENTSSFIYVALMLCILYPTFKFMSRYALVEVGFSIFDTIASIISLVGMYFLFNEQ